MHRRSVSSLRTKLDRLGSAGPSRTASPPIAAGVSYFKGPAPQRDRVEVVQALREAITRVMARKPVASASPADPTVGDLPFAAVETDHGTLYVREVSFEPHHRVGRFPVGPAKHSDAAMLSLLALDPAIASLDLARALYLDTETTGLSGGTGTLPFLIGLGFFSAAGHFVVEQLFLRRPGEEAPILARVASRLQDASMLVTFNGKAFDMPLVRTRFVMNRMSEPPARAHLDLLHVARRLHRARIGSCSLGAVENGVLGFGRVDDVPSCEVSVRYAHFLRTGDEAALLGVIGHNTWDVVTMAALVGLYGEPSSGLHAEDLAHAAQTAQRAKASECAAGLANEAVARGGGAVATRARGLIAKARGDRDRALADFESLVKEVDDPQARLELAKLYEHHCKAPRAALRVVEQGTVEAPTDAARRHARLKAKIERDDVKACKACERQHADVGQGTLPGFLPTHQDGRSPNGTAP